MLLTLTLSHADWCFDSMLCPIHVFRYRLRAQLPPAVCGADEPIALRVQGVLAAVLGAVDHRRPRCHDDAPPLSRVQKKGGGSFLEKNLTLPSPPPTAHHPTQLSFPTNGVCRPSATAVKRRPRKRPGSSSQLSRTFRRTRKMRMTPLHRRRTKRMGKRVGVQTSKLGTRLMRSSPDAR